MMRNSLLAPTATKVVLQFYCEMVVVSGLLPIINWRESGGMADALDLGSCALGRESSSLSSRMIVISNHLEISMQFEITDISNHQQRLIVQIPHDTIESKAVAELQSLQKKANINGFRRGKAPLALIRRQYGVDATDTAVEQIARDFLNEAIATNKAQPISPATVSIEPLESGKDATVEFVYDVYPEVEIGDLSTLAVVEYQSSITDEDIESMIEEMQEQAGSYHAVERPAAKGDQIVFRFVRDDAGTAITDSKPEDEKPEVAKQVEFVLDGQRLAAYPGFSQCLGVVKGSDVTVDVEPLRQDKNGKAIASSGDNTIKIHITCIKEFRKSALDEDFYQRFEIPVDADSDPLKQLIGKLRVSLTLQKEQRVFDLLSREIVKQLVDNFDFGLPQSMIAKQAEGMRQQYISQMVQQQIAAGMNQKFNSQYIDNLDAHIKVEQFLPQAKQQLKQILFLEKVIKQQNIQIDDTAVEARLQEVAAEYGEPETFIFEYKKDSKKIEDLRQILKIRQAIHWLKAAMNVQAQPIGWQELRALKSQVFSDDVHDG